MRQTVEAVEVKARGRNAARWSDADQERHRWDCVRPRTCPVPVVPRWASVVRDRLYHMRMAEILPQ